MIIDRPPRQTKKNALEVLSSIGFKPECIIDAGYGFGTKGLFDNFPSAKKIAIEPLSEFEEIIKLHCKKDKNLHYEKAILSNSNDERKISKRPGLTSSSLYFENNSNNKIEVCKSTTIDELSLKYNLHDKILLKLDLEGHELDALRGATKTLNKIEIIICEMSLWRHKNKNIPSLFELFSFFEKNNFYLIDIIELGYTGATNMMQQFDGVFLNRNSNLAKIKTIKTEEQRQKTAAHKTKKYLRMLENARKS